MVPLCQQPENPMNGFGLSVGTDLKNLVVIDSLIRRHTALPIGSRFTRLSARPPRSGQPGAGTPAVCMRNFGPNGIPYGAPFSSSSSGREPPCPYVTHVDFWPCPRQSVLIASLAHAQATQTGTKPFEPTVGQAGKDVVWVPTPQALVERMLDLAKVTPQDFLMDLGSGDGRTVITAAKRGAARAGR